MNRKVARRVALLSALVISTQVAVRTEAATVIHSDRSAFTAELVSSFTDTYGAELGYPGSFGILSNAAMSAVVGQTRYQSTGFNNHNIVVNGTYCAGCNGSFKLDFADTGYSKNGGVFGAGLDILANGNGLYDALVTFANGSSALYGLSGGGFWGITSHLGIASIAFGPEGGQSKGGYFQIDNLSIGTVPEPSTWLLLIAGFGMVGFGLRRKPIAVTLS
ncbi:PEPxxWA-CTERM sorting domain-containing protein [Sandaracinobacter sp. RS1-74]|uniref:PEPxxWA-CTERM sorting domain-containing protein n=1 Tax=Sandaracinobacteroides sayramensis TaxID=2913411 RepID=UPI001EDBCA7D|nr:PEPxxWA-CTERM sorting domain-containing protein [Sandaracinobacteroides sayramensis]MCG2840288.1 PEPxxWA-CTERM sorting domain-containing protein [Sandaracinobacteroides sayramensis]